MIKHQGPTNLGQIKAPTIITERPATEESDPTEQYKSQIVVSDKEVDSFKLDRNASFM
jgi:hypothetical protein